MGAHVGDWLQVVDALMAHAPRPVDDCSVIETHWVHPADSGACPAQVAALHAPSPRPDGPPPSAPDSAASPVSASNAASAAPGAQSEED